MLLSVLVTKKQLVVPGDLLAEGDFVPGENVFKDSDKLYSQKLGVVDLDGKTIHVVALRGRYMPLVDDIVIGQVVDVGLNGWTLNINAPYYAQLNVSDVLGKSFGPRVESLTNILAVGDLVIGKIVSFDRTRDPSITVQGQGLGQVKSGTIIEITPTKVPRLIGRNGSMIGIIKQETGCEITVGQNGKVLILGRQSKNIDLVIKCVKMIENESHTSGLTDRIKTLIQNEKMSEKK